MPRQPLKVGEKLMFGIFGAFVVLAVISFVILEVVRAKSSKPMFQPTMHFDFTAEGLRGSELFREARCTSCHRAMRNGTNMGLSLDGLGSRRSKEWIVNFLTNPEATYDARTIDHGPAPKEAAYVAEIPRSELMDIAAFLSELRADVGSAAAPKPPEGRSEFIDNMLKVWAPKEWDEKYSDIRTKAPEGEPPAERKP
jgi:cytochrome c553